MIGTTVALVLEYPAPVPAVWGLCFFDKIVYFYGSEEETSVEELDGYFSITPRLDIRSGAAATFEDLFTPALSTRPLMNYGSFYAFLFINSSASSSGSFP